MDINRNQYFLAGLVLLFLGLQFRLIESVDLTPRCVSFLGENSNQLAILARSAVDASNTGQVKAPPKTVQPPEWLGWALLSLGAVLVLHSMAMKRPE